MSENEISLLDAAKEAIGKVRTDTSLELAAKLSAMEDIQAHVDTLIEDLEDSLSDQDVEDDEDEE